MKKTWACPKCQSRRVGYLENLVDRSPSGQEDRKYIGYQRAGELFGITAFRVGGEVEAYVCADCGYFEEYVKDPQHIPWDTMRGFRWCIRQQ
jgi:predicted nucleic-acid-binding Zn-ribbon protein